LKIENFQEKRTPLVPSEVESYLNFFMKKLK